MTRPVRAALLLVLLLAACGGSGTAESPLGHRVEHLEEHGFDVEEVAPGGNPMPEAMAVVQLDGATATIYAYGARRTRSVRRASSPRRSRRPPTVCASSGKA
jgi:hypothetical protein